MNRKITSNNNSHTGINNENSDGPPSGIQIVAPMRLGKGRPGSVELKQRLLSIPKNPNERKITYKEGHTFIHDMLGRISLHFSKALLHDSPSRNARESYWAYKELFRRCHPYLGDSFEIVKNPTHRYPIMRIFFKETPHIRYWWNIPPRLERAMITYDRYENGFRMIPSMSVSVNMYRETIYYNTSK